MFWKNEEVLVVLERPQMALGTQLVLNKCFGGISSADTQAHPLLTLQAQRSPLSAFLNPFLNPAGVLG